MQISFKKIKGSICFHPSIDNMQETISIIQIVGKRITQTSHQSGRKLREKVGKMKLTASYGSQVDCTERLAAAMHNQLTQTTDHCGLCGLCPSLS